MYQAWDERKPVFILKNTRIVGFKLAVLCVTVVLVAFGIGVLIGTVTRSFHEQTSTDSYYSFLIRDDKDNVVAREKLFREIDSENIKKHLKYITSFAHRAGTYGGKVSSDYIAEQWKSQGVDVVKEIDYDVLLDVPDQSRLNRLDIIDKDKKVEKSVEIKESIYDKELNYTDLAKPFLAFSMNGSAESSEIYYVNNCDLKDFLYITKNVSIDLTDKIVLCKYGGLFRGNKVKLAEKFGVKGVLLFDDPKRSAPAKSVDKKYPDGWLLPEDGTQRGCIYTKDGDPITPMYPAKSYMHRIEQSEQEGLPRIVAQVIGYGLAAEIFNLIDDKTSSSNLQIPQDWKGELNVTYSFGGKLKENRSLSINVYGERKIQKIYNVVGIVKGSVEPDRYVMIGNHKDSWDFGAMDPNSGTSVLLEVTRSLLALKKTGDWIPKRSVIFLAWDAEEYGLFGSTEWVEEFKSKLIANSVLYINCDTAIQGTFALSAKASPLVHNWLYETAKLVKIPDSQESLYDRWLKNEPDQYDPNVPWINPNLGSSSDHTAFTQRAGVSCLDLRLVRNYSDPVYKYVKGSFPLYHSSYETFKLVNEYIDPGFKASRTIAQLFAELIRSASSSLILPFNATRYADILNSEFIRFDDKYSKQLNSLGLSLVDVKTAVTKFTQSTREFQSRLNLLDKTQYHLVRACNEQLRSLERAFLDDYNLKTTGHAHTIFAPSLINKYISNTFPFVVNALYDYDMANSSETKQDALNKVKMSLSILTYSIQAASNIIREPVDFDSWTTS